MELSIMGHRGKKNFPSECMETVITTTGPSPCAIDASSAKYLVLGRLCHIEKKKRGGEYTPGRTEVTQDMSALVRASQRVG